MRHPIVGDAPADEDYDRVYVHAAFDRDGIRYLPIPDYTIEKFDRARAALLALTRYDTPAMEFLRGEWNAVDALGDHLALWAGLEQPNGALAHRSVALAYHVDTQMPCRCTNLTVTFRHGTSGGALVLPGRRLAFGCGDGWAAIFDGQELYGVTPIVYDHQDGYRVSLTYYTPRA